MSDSDVILRAKRFNVERVIQTAPDGTEHVREIVRHPGAAVILPLLDDGRLVCIRNYRVAVDETLIELPAGTLESDEDPLLTAKRELAEETGYEAGYMEHLITFYMSPGILDEKMHLYLATHLKACDMALEPGEEIQPFPTSWDEVMAMVRGGAIRDAKSLVGLFYYDRFKR